MNWKESGKYKEMITIFPKYKDISKDYTEIELACDLLDFYNYKKFFHERCDKLEAKLDKIKLILMELHSDLNINGYTSIGNGSKMHDRIIDALEIK